jgi:hypothetical protein
LLGCKGTSRKRVLVVMKVVDDNILSMSSGDSGIEISGPEMIGSDDGRWKAGRDYKGQPR